jgi:PTS system mannose-specific IID component
MSPRWQTMIRLLGVQAAWSYERMSGIGVGHAAAPLLRELYRGATPGQRRAAVARSAEYFNSHPYLAGVAVGAVVRAERDEVPGATISRLRTALSGPLGSLGDQLVWTGEVPALMGLALALLPVIGWWSVVLVLIVHNSLRLRLTLWGLDLGLAEGLRVGAALEKSGLPGFARRLQRVAAATVGMAIPVTAVWLLGEVPEASMLEVGAVALVGAALTIAPQTRTRVTGLRMGIGLLVLALLVIGGTG